jgi:transglutaminase-like putative cysteine protease
MKTLRKMLITSLIVLLAHSTFGANNPEYALAKLPEKFQSGSKAVLREASVIIEIEAPDKVIEHHREVLTIFKESAFSKAFFTAFYSDFVNVSDIDIEIFDATGERVRKVRNADIKDFSAIDNSTIFSDARVKAYRPDYKEYPFTIVSSYRVKRKTTFFLPWWTPHYGEDVPVLKNSLKVIYPKDYSLRFKEFNINGKRTEKEIDDTKVIEWVYNNYVPEDSEPFSPLYPQTLPTVALAPGNFELDGNVGNMETWEGFGRFIAGLNQNRQKLPEETIAEVKQLTANIEDDREKVKVLYEYMQGRTRYVSIQMGIGGWQPFEAETVDEMEYGDCKALSNYMRALLMAAGIKSNYTLVRAGSRPIPLTPDFPQNNFNHAILSVPLPKDTVWLECTSQYMPFDFLGTFTDGRKVLMIDDGVGKLTTTPALTEKDNLRQTTGKISLDGSGNAMVSCKTNYKGTYYDDMSYLIDYMDEKDREKAITKSLHMRGFSLKGYDLKQHKEAQPSLERKVDFSVEKYATSMGSRAFLPLNTFNRFTDVPLKLEKRKWPVFIQRGWHEQDSWTIAIPENANIQVTPDDVNIQTPFGHYQSSVKKEEGSLIYTREFLVKKGEYAPEKYNEFRAFLAKVAHSDQQKCLLEIH